MTTFKSLCAPSVEFNSTSGRIEVSNDGRKVGRSVYKNWDKWNEEHKNGVSGGKTPLTPPSKTTAKLPPSAIAQKQTKASHSTNIAHERSVDAIGKKGDEAIKGHTIAAAAHDAASRDHAAAGNETESDVHRRMAAVHQNAVSRLKDGK